jgi:hypothetical protein
VDTFALALIVAVPLLYGLFWWLDYRWLDTQSEVVRNPDEPDPDDAW